LSTATISTTMTLREYFDAVYVPDRLLCGSEHTIEHYYKSFRQFGRTLKRTPTLADLTTENIAAALKSWQRRKLGKEYVRRFRVSLCSIWRHAGRNGHADADWTYLDSPGHTGYAVRFDHALDRFAGYLEAPEPSGEMSLVKFFDKMYRPRRLLQSSPHVVRKYQRAIARLGDELGRSPLVGDLNEGNILLIAERLINSGRSAGTANDNRKQLVALGNFAVKRGYLRQFDDVAKLKVNEPAPTAWRQDDLQRLMDAVAKVTRGRKIFGGLTARWFWESFIRLMLDTGIRFGAQLQLNWSDVDLDSGIVTVRAETQKDRSGQRFPLKPATVECLRRIREPKRKMVFQPSYDRSAFPYWLAKFLKAAGLPSTRRDKFHRLRRTVASWYEHAGGDASDLLGHSNRSTTRKYLDPTIATKIHAADVMFDLPLAAGGPT
jgi:integrase